MAARLSKALRNYINSGGGLKEALQGGKILVYSGPQPATPEAAPTGTLLVTFTENSGAHTAEVQATGTFTLSGASGSVNTLLVNGIEIMGSATPFNTDLTTTAADCVRKINSNPKNILFFASSLVDVITITARRGLGAIVNTWALTKTLTTMTAAVVDMAGGVSSVNGIKFGESATGQLICPVTGQTVTGVAVADGVAGWARFVGGIADSGVADVTESQVRMDLAIGTSGAQLNVTGSTTIASGSTQTLPTCAITLPTA